MKVMLMGATSDIVDTKDLLTSTLNNLKPVLMTTADSSGGSLNFIILSEDFTKMSQSCQLPQLQYHFVSFVVQILIAHLLCVTENLTSHIRYKLNVGPIAHFQTGLGFVSATSRVGIQFFSLSISKNNL